MPNLANKKHRFITRFREQITALIDSTDQIKALVNEYHDLDYANVLVDADFNGENEHIGATDLAAATALMEALFTSNESDQSSAILFKIRQ
jgi:hypothetical protein